MPLASSNKTGRKAIETLKGLSKYRKDTQTMQRRAKTRKDGQRRAKTHKDTQRHAKTAKDV